MFLRNLILPGSTFKFRMVSLIFSHTNCIHSCIPSKGIFFILCQKPNYLIKARYFLCKIKMIESEVDNMITFLLIEMNKFFNLKNISVNLVWGDSVE